MPPKKDPNKPKGRTSAYAFFVQEKRNESKAKGEEVDFTAFSKECADKWKDSRLDKGSYIKKAEVDKARYEREMASYQPPDGGKKKPGKKQKDPNMPKRAM
jgi:hypothetical protein